MADLMPSRIKVDDQRFGGPMDSVTKDFVAVGIDPGLTGYISVVNEDGKYLEHHKTPILTDVKHIKKRTGARAGQVVTKTKNTLDELGIFHILCGIKSR